MQTAPHTEPSDLLSAPLQAYRQDSSAAVFEFLNGLEATQIVQQSIANTTAFLSYYGPTALLV